MTNKISRRAILMRGVQIPIGSALLLAGCGGDSGEQRVGCADPDAMSEGEKNMRASVRYVEVSADPQKTCAGCAFFKAAEAQVRCAPCEILHGSVSSQGHCDSWSAKA